MSLAWGWGPTHPPPLPQETVASRPSPTVAWTDLGLCEGGSSLARSGLVRGGGHCLILLAAHEGLCSRAPTAAPGRPLSPPRRSRRLEEEQQAALAALSQQLEAITDVEELTKLVSDRVPRLTVCRGDPASLLGVSLLQLRAAGEYEERKLIRAAIRKLRAEEIEGEAPFLCPGVATMESLECGQLLPKRRLCSYPAAALAGNVQSSRRDGSEPHAVPGDVKSNRRDDAETPALAGSGKSSQRCDTELPALAGSEESHGEGSTKPLATARSGESSQQDDAEQLTLAGLEESGCGGAAEQPPAQERKGSAVSVQGAAGEMGPPKTSSPSFPRAPVPASLGHKPPGMLGSLTRGDWGRWSWGLWGRGLAVPVSPVVSWGWGLRPVCPWASP